MVRRTRSLEDTASRLWTGAENADIFDTPLHVVGGASAPGLPILNRMQSILPLVSARDELALWQSQFVLERAVGRERGANRRADLQPRGFLRVKAAGAEEEKEGEAARIAGFHN